VIEVFATSRRGQIFRYVQSGTSFDYPGPAVFNFWDAASPPTVTKNQDG
jgi:hypothetical protein